MHIVGFTRFLLACPVKRLGDPCTFIHAKITRISFDGTHGNILMTRRRHMLLFVYAESCVFTEILMFTGMSDNIASCGYILFCSLYSK